LEGISYCSSASFTRPDQKPAIISHHDTLLSLVAYKLRGFSNLVQITSRAVPQFLIGADSPTDKE
jgi:hypothetical protein